MSELVKRLKAFEVSDELGNGDFSVVYQAAAEFDRLKARVAVLEEALRVCEKELTEVCWRHKVNEETGEFDTNVEDFSAALTAVRTAKGLG